MFDIVKGIFGQGQAEKAKSMSNNLKQAHPPQGLKYQSNSGNLDLKIKGVSNFRGSKQSNYFYDGHHSFSEKEISNSMLSKHGCYRGIYHDSFGVELDVKVYLTPVYLAIQAPVSNDEHRSSLLLPWTKIYKMSIMKKNDDQFYFEVFTRMELKIALNFQLMESKTSNSDLHKFKEFYSHLVNLQTKLQNIVQQSNLLMFSSDYNKTLKLAGTAIYNEDKDLGNEPVTSEDKISISRMMYMDYNRMLKNYNNFDYQNLKAPEGYYFIQNTSSKSPGSSLVNKTPTLDIPTYPPLLLYPIEAQFHRLQASTSHRSKKRIMALSYFYQRCSNEKSGCLFRSSQPCSGITDSLNKDDTELTASLAYAGVQGINYKNKAQQLQVFDCRPFKNAAANSIGGKGYMSQANYPNCNIKFGSIGNIHDVRSSFYEVVNGCNQDQLQQSSYLSMLRIIMSGVCQVTSYLYQGESVLVHCSDGWDRTSQICALSKLMLDDYYRKFQGFKILITEEFIAFGHKFKERQIYENGREKSPVFIQFLDVVHQLIQQNPNDFEFNSLFLRDLAVCYFENRFVQFITDHPREFSEYLSGKRDGNKSTAYDNYHSKSAFGSESMQGLKESKKSQVDDYAGLDVWAYLDYKNRPCYYNNSFNLRKSKKDKPYLNLNCDFNKIRIWYEFFGCARLDSIGNSSFYNENLEAYEQSREFIQESNCQQDTILNF